MPYSREHAKDDPSIRAICAAVEWFCRFHVRKAALREGCSYCLSAAAAAVLVSETLGPAKIAMARTQNIAIVA